VKNLSKYLFVISFFGVLLLVFSSCNEAKQLKYEDFDEEDFVLVPGIVTKITRTPIYARGDWYKYNVYYAYNLDSDSVSVGKKMDVDMAVNEGDGIYVLVHKEDEDISFLVGLRLKPNDEDIMEKYLRKSKDNGVKYFGVKEQ
jgi:hypothetical protein|tara:strand:- start:2515 stop:2943 length:429 start_codon:yes stop_codon:yes gene_type:complete